MDKVRMTYVLTWGSLVLMSFSGLYLALMSYL